MNRRAFLKDAASALLVLPFGAYLVNCSSEDDEEVPLQPDNAPPAAEPLIQDGEIVFTSNRVKKHSHAFRVIVEDFAEAPDTGITGDTTNSQGHNHALVITQDALRMADGGQQVKIQTATTDGHSHTFTIVKL